MSIGALLRRHPSSNCSRLLIAVSTHDAGRRPHPYAHTRLAPSLPCCCRVAVDIPVLVPQQTLPYVWQGQLPAPTSPWPSQQQGVSTPACLPTQHFQRSPPCARWGTQPSAASARLQLDHRPDWSSVTWTSSRMRSGQEVGTANSGGFEHRRSFNDEAYKQRHNPRTGGGDGASR